MYIHIHASKYFARTYSTAGLSADNAMEMLELFKGTISSDTALEIIERSTVQN
jgi:hypothetical protein